MSNLDDELISLIMEKILALGEVRSFLAFSSTCSRFRRISFTNRMTIRIDSWDVATRLVSHQPIFGMLSLVPHVLRMSDIRWRAASHDQYDEEEVNRTNKNGFDLEELAKILTMCHSLGGPNSDQKLILDMTYSREDGGNIVKRLLGLVPRLQNLKIYRPIGDKMCRRWFLGSKFSPLLISDTSSNISNLCLYGSDIIYEQGTHSCSDLISLALFWTRVRINMGARFPRLLRFTLRVNCYLDLKNALRIISGSPSLEYLSVLITCFDSPVILCGGVALDNLDYVRVGVGWNGAPSSCAVGLLRMLAECAPNVTKLDLVGIPGISPHDLGFRRISRFRNTNCEGIQK